jgi:integrase
MGRTPDVTGLEVRSGSIRIVFYWRNRRCRETLKLEPSKANLTYAARLRGEILRKIELGTFDYAEYFPDSDLARASVKAATPTFRSLATTWLAAADLQKSTREGYEKSLKKYIYTPIGDKPIDQVTHLMLTELLGAIKASKKTRNNTLIPIRRVFDLAFTDGLIPANHAARLRYARHQLPEPDPFSPDEVDAILARIKQRYGTEVENWFGLGFFAGMRTSEQLALRWPDVDFKNNVILVKRARVRHEEKETKTAKARYHELSARARVFIERHRAHTQLKGDAVFLDPVTGNLYNDDKPPRERYWRPTLAALGLRYREPYQMRHTYATMAIMAGASPIYVARQMGNSPRIVFKHYARWIESADRGRERAKIDAFLDHAWKNQTAT